MVGGPRRRLRCLDRLPVVGLAVGRKPPDQPPEGRGRVRARRPELSTAGLVLRAFAVMCALDFVMESVWLTTGSYTYGGAHRSLSLWAGRYYQFPVYEILLWGITWTGLACVRFFRDDRGQTVAERGVDGMSIGPG